MPEYPDDERDMCEAYEDWRSTHPEEEAKGRRERMDKAARDLLATREELRKALTELNEATAMLDEIEKGRKG